MVGQGKGNLKEKKGNPTHFHTLGGGKKGKEGAMMKVAKVLGGKFLEFNFSQTGCGPFLVGHQSIKTVAFYCFW